MKSIGDFAMGFVVGCLTGGAVALLLAPQSGEETQKMIGKRASELRESAETEIQKLEKAAESQIEDVKTKANGAVSDVKHRAESLQAKGTVLVRESREHLTKAVDEVKEAVAEAG